MFCYVTFVKRERERDKRGHLRGGEGGGEEEATLERQKGALERGGGNPLSPLGFKESKLTDHTLYSLIREMEEARRKAMTTTRLLRQRCTL